MIGLAIDTSTTVMGVALVKDATVLAEIITNEKKNHSVRLMPAIEHVMKEVGLTPKQLGRIIVAKGPGSYTGVRIGVSVAKALAWTLNIPLVGISSLEALALNGRYFDGLISPIIDARRQQVYTGLYRFHHGTIEQVVPDKIILSAHWAEQLQEHRDPILFLGYDVPLHRDALQQNLGEQAIFGELSEHAPRPGELALLGLQREPEENVHLFTPNYAQLAEAEKNWLVSQKSQSKEQ